MADTEEHCVLLTSEKLSTGYYSCETPISGSELQIKFSNQSTEEATLAQISGLNIFPSRNLVTMTRGGVARVYESSHDPDSDQFSSLQSSINNSFAVDFDREAVPRDSANQDNCMVYYKNSALKEFPSLTLDLGQHYRSIDAV